MLRCMRIAVMELCPRVHACVRVRMRVREVQTKAPQRLIDAGLRIIEHGIMTNASIAVALIRVSIVLVVLVGMAPCWHWYWH